MYHESETYSHAGTTGLFADFVTGRYFECFVFGSFGYANMSLYDRHLSLVLSLVLTLVLSLVLSVLLASVSVDSLPSNFQNGCL